MHTWHTGCFTLMTNSPHTSYPSPSVHWPSPSSVREFTMHLTHLHPQQWTQISHQMSEAFWHIIVLTKCIICTRRCRKKEIVDVVWVQKSHQFSPLKSQQPSTQQSISWRLSKFSVNSSTPAHPGDDCGFLISPRSFQSVPRSRVPVGARDVVTGHSGGRDRVTGRACLRRSVIYVVGKVSCAWWGGMAWFVRYASRHVAHRHLRRLPAHLPLLSTSSPRLRVSVSTLLPWGR